MERSALYRRALAPIMIFTGIAGVAGGGVGWLLGINSERGFISLWLGIAAFALIGSFLLVRRQALKDSEAFWSPPTKRIASALLPPFSIGALVNIVVLLGCHEGDLMGNKNIMLIVSWCWLYGCAIHSAGFFMPGRSRLFAWPFVLAGGILFCSLSRAEWLLHVSPHLLMVAIFGGLVFGRLETELHARLRPLARIRPRPSLRPAAGRLPCPIRTTPATAPSPRALP